MSNIARDRIALIHKPVVGDDFDTLADGSAPDAWLDKPGPPVFVNASRLVAQKDHATLLRAFALVLRWTPARLLILGKGCCSPSWNGSPSSSGCASMSRSWGSSLIRCHTSGGLPPSFCRRATRVPATC